MNTLNIIDHHVCILTLKLISILTVWGCVRGDPRQSGPGTATGPWDGLPLGVVPLGEMEGVIGRNC